MGVQQLGVEFIEVLSQLPALLLQLDPSGMRGTLGPERVIEQGAELPGFDFRYLPRGVGRPSSGEQALVLRLNLALLLVVLLVFQGIRQFLKFRKLFDDLLGLHFGRTGRLDFCRDGLQLGAFTYFAVDLSTPLVASTDLLVELDGPGVIPDLFGDGVDLVIEILDFLLGLSDCRDGSALVVNLPVEIAFRLVCLLDTGIEGILIG